MVKIKKTIVERVRSLNDSGVLQGELRLPGVATPLAQLEDETTALEILTGLEEQADSVDDPTKWVQEAAKAVLDRRKKEREEVDVETEEPEWADGAGPRGKSKTNGTDKGGAKAGGKGGGKPGDWECPTCGDLNFARNAVCRRCGDSPAPAKKRKYEEIPKAKPGDWTCPSCGDLVFARNVSCRSCGKPRPVAGCGGKGDAKGKPGDWTCPNCGDLVFARNQACRSCQTPRPASSGSGKPGDWICPSCNDFQFAKNEVCRSCNEPRPESAVESFKAARKPGDWECPKCGDLQFARNMACRRCGADRPDDVDD